MDVAHGTKTRLGALALALPLVIMTADEGRAARVQDRVPDAGRIGAPLTDQPDANRLTIALTTDQVDVDAGFSGARLTLFGVINDDNRSSSPDRDTQIVAILTGPPKDVRGRPMIRTGPIWTAANATRILDVPGLYYVLSSAPMAIIAEVDVQHRYGLAPDALTFAVQEGGALPTEKDADGAPNPEDAARDQGSAHHTDATPAKPDTPRLTREMIKTLIANRKDQNLFRRREGAIRRMQNGLFAVDIDLPAQTPVGTYAVTVSAWQGGKPIASDRASLAVRKAGVERLIYDFARNHAFFYGITCVLISLIAGWAVSLVFRRR
ncbi:MAG: TIGR02186 family protein [Pseudomonadota bacterium]